MADCEIFADCVFFDDKMASKPATAELMKDRYCLGDESQCARYKVYKALGGEKVPTDLFPNQTDRADRIILNI